MEHLPKEIHQRHQLHLVETTTLRSRAADEESRPIGRWGRMHFVSAEHRPGQYNALLLLENSGHILLT